MPNIQEESEDSQHEVHETDPEVSFHPHHHLQPPTSQVGHPQPAWQGFTCTILKVHTWTGW